MIRKIITFPITHYVPSIKFPNRKQIATFSGKTIKMTNREALNSAMFEEMDKDSNVFLIGEEVAQYNGAYKISKGLMDKFGT